MRTGLFGGTFDPIHLGHLVSGDQVGSLLGLDQVIFIPCANPPHKPCTMEDATHRYRMIEEAITGHDNFRASRIEMERLGHSYSIDTIREIKKSNPDWEPMYFILGIDAFLDIESWKEYERFLSLVTLVITSRPGYGLSDLRTKLNRTILSFLEPLPDRFLAVTTRESSGNLNRSHKPGTQIYIEIPSIDISATEIRLRLRKKLSVRYIIPDSVKKYIDKYKLYR